MKKVLFISIALFVVSLTQKAFCTESDCGDSIAVFLSGPLGLAFVGANLTWLANPFLLISWLKFNKKPKDSLITSLIATIVALSFLLFNKIIANEGGSDSKIMSYRLGYWLWVSSCTIMFAGNLFYTVKRNNVRYERPVVGQDL